MANTIDLNKVQHAVETIAEQLGIDLSAFGNASPTKLILETLKASTQIIQQATQVAITEQNPLTATELRSKIGLAALVGLNPAQLMTASTGKVTVSTDGRAVTIGQHAKLRSKAGIDYYAVLPSETIKFVNDAQIMVRQGTLQTSTFTVSGEPWESFVLAAANYVDCNSIEAFYNNQRLKVGFKLDEDADVYVRPNYDGEIELVLSNAQHFEAGEAIVVSYADCLGIDGDNINVDEEMEVNDFAYDNNSDVTEHIFVVISEAIIGGTDFATFDADLTNEIMLSGHNNLVGTEAQLIQYARRFKQYTVQSARIDNGVFRLSVIRNLQQLATIADYWQSINNLEVNADELLSLARHLNQYSGKSLDLVCSVISGTLEYCRVNVDVQMDEASVETIHDTVVDYLLSRLQIGTYEVAGLYKALLAVDGVNECNVSYDGYTNKYGTAQAKSSTALLICCAANITVNGATTSYGDFSRTENDDIDLTVDRITRDKMTNILEQ